MTRSTLVRTLGVGALVAAAPLIGCDRRQVHESELQREPTREELEARKDWTDEPSSVGGGPVDLGDAITRIVEARCARESACGFVGAEQKWASSDACTEVVTREYSDDLSPEDCPAGVDAKELDECITEARNADCNNPIDVIGRVAACRTSDLCRNFQ